LNFSFLLSDCIIFYTIRFTLFDVFQFDLFLGFLFLRRLGLRTRTQIAVWAVERGLYRSRQHEDD